jgi:hypothetical protein
MRIHLAAVLVAGAASGCASFGPVPDAGVDPMMVGPAAAPAAKPSTLGSIGNAVLSVPETAIWWPYKIVGSAARGTWDGVAGGVERSGNPVAGVIVSPFTATAGLLKGTAKGVTRGPHYVKDTATFGKSLKEPWVQPVEVFGK